MAHCPFEITIKAEPPETNAQKVICQELLRDIPGKRQIYSSLWEKQPVIVKIFADSVKSNRHLKRELSGLQKLRSRNLNCPAVLFAGRTNRASRVLVTKKITDAPTALEIFANLSSAEEKLDLLLIIVEELASHHDKGVLQKDLHLGNILIKGRKAFIIDSAGMRFYNNAVNKKKSLAQLAMVARYLSPDNPSLIDRLAVAYCDARKRPFGHKEKNILYKCLAGTRKRGIRKGLKKSLRTSTRYLKIKKPAFVAIFGRTFIGDKNPDELVNNLDELMSKGNILKNGNTCYVSRVFFNGFDIVVKRYNHKGVFHSIRQTIKKSRARKNWLCARRLGMLQIPTAAPLGYIEVFKGPIIWKSYIITRYLPGPKLCDLLKSTSSASNRQSTAINQVIELLKKLGKARITHGDLKHSNIIITDKGPAVIDLDAMRAHKFKFTYKPRRAYDLKHFATKGPAGKISLQQLDE